MDELELIFLQVKKFTRDHWPVVLFAAMVVVQLDLSSAWAVDQAKFKEVCKKILDNDTGISGQLGALIAASAGLGAILASAMGGFRAAWALLVTSVGAFIANAFVQLFYSGGDCK